MNTKCDVCNRERPVQVAASSLGAFSLAYCWECAIRYAEPIGYLATLYKELHGDVALFILETETWNGQYVTFGDMLPMQDAPDVTP